MYLSDYNFTLIACDQTSVSPVIPVSSCSNTGPIQEGPYLEGVSEVKSSEIGLDPYWTFSEHHFILLFRNHMPTVTYLRLDGSTPAGQRHSLVQRYIYCSTRSLMGKPLRIHAIEKPLVACDYPR